MSEDELKESTITVAGTTHDELSCPFSRGKWKKVGDALVFFMLFVIPVLFLVALIMTRLH